MESEDRPDEAKRLEHARRVRGFERPIDAARYHGWSYATYIQHEQGKRGITRAADKYAKAFHVSKAWLLTGEGDGPDTKFADNGKNIGSFTNRQYLANHNQSSLKILGRVAAGVWREIDLTDEIEQESVVAIAHPGFPVDAQYVLIVEGNSLNKIAADGDYLLCVSIAQTGLEPKAGDLVIVERLSADGGLIETTAKRIQRRDGFYELHPESTDPQFQQPIIVPENPEHEFETVRIVAKVLLISKKP